eukprot:SAG22_NODE_5766_length_956_cov_1.323221_2_plen_112_part_00
MCLSQQAMCEGCGTKQPHYGLPAERKRRWCDLKPRHIEQPDRETTTRSGRVTTTSRGTQVGPSVVDREYPLLAAAISAAQESDDDLAVLFHLRCLAKWQTEARQVPAGSRG